MLQFKKVAFYTLGCKLNFSETSSIARQIISAGYARVDFDDMPDVFIINTCSVTDHADKKCRNIVRKALRINAEAVVIVIGCYAQLKPTEIASIEGVNLVLGAEEKFNIVEYLEASTIFQKQRSSVGKIKDLKEFVPGFSSGDRTRTFLKVQDGCNYFCAFCTIPLARGRSRNNSIEDTLASCEKAIAAGAKEIVLTGVNIGDFGNGSSENFLQLITALDRLDGVKRFRISSIEPNLLSHEIIHFVANSKKFTPHFHIPLQSGSDKILTAMRRRYQTDSYADRLTYVKQLMPDACIGIDVIAGFPGETEADFDITYRFLRSLPASYFHVFTYSERANTTALRILDNIPMEVRHTRTKMLRILSNKKKKAFYASQSGKSATVLFEGQEEGGWMYGFTENYVKVKAPFQATWINEMIDLNIGEIDRDGIAKAVLFEPERVY